MKFYLEVLFQMEYSEGKYKVCFFFVFFWQMLIQKIGRQAILLCYLRHDFSLYPKIFPSLFSDLKEHSCQLLHYTYVEEKKDKTKILEIRKSNSCLDSKHYLCGLG